jgi:enterochelin esterase-like enzyme
MNPRQAILIATLLTLLPILSACSAFSDNSPAVTVTAPPPTATISPSPSPIPPTATSTPFACLTQPGRIESGAVTATIPAQEYLIYLPPCYDEFTDQRYPVLYLLHGQTYTMDQWVRLGVPQTADQMFISGESTPFIIVFPDDSFWNLSAGSSFGARLVGALVPYIDVNYRTIPNRENRALGGLSRGGGWVAQLGFENPNLFGSLGLHSPAVFKGDGYYVEKLVQAIPDDARPRLWLDTGDVDREWRSIIEFEEMLTRNDYPHEFRRYVGDHSELYWGAHVRDYLLWYAEAWNEQPEGE